MNPWAEIVSGDLVLKEHEAAKWLTKDELDSVEWLPADVTLIEKVRAEIKTKSRGIDSVKVGDIFPFFAIFYAVITEKILKR